MNAFKNCPNLTTIIIESSETLIDDSAFDNTGDLVRDHHNIILPARYKHIENAIRSRGRYMYEKDYNKLLLIGNIILPELLKFIASYL